ncbi:MAG: hypothetical protein ABIU54_07480 [Candidatus Eisenbacteria bacterium]
MQPLFEIPVSAAGLLTAAASVIAGAPWFADGLRSLRARQALDSVRPEPFTGPARGMIELQGQVELESPMFSPLSARACAGYVLEVSGVGTRVGGSVSESRPFHLVEGELRARVEADTVTWQLGITAEREVAAGAAIPERIRALLDRNADLRWLRAQGGALRLVERALCAGVQCHVLGEVRHERVVTQAEEDWVARTGTDGEAFAASSPMREEGMTLRVVASEVLERIVVADGAVDTARLTPPLWRTVGTLCGPALCLAGLLYLAHAADRMLGARLG